jgi:uncharacterized membrane protein
MRVSGWAVAGGLSLLAVGCDQAPAEKAPPPPPPAPKVTLEQRAAAGEWGASFEARGVEPFWTAKVSGDVIRLEREDAPPVEVAYALPNVRANQATWTAPSFVLSLTKERCSDLVSNSDLGYLAAVQIGEIDYQGCAKRIRGAEEPPWTADLARLLPAIDACLKKDPRPAVVTHAELRSVGDAVIRLSFVGLDIRTKCVVDSQGKAPPKRFDPIKPGDVLYDENDPLFARFPGIDPATACAPSSPVNGPDGAQIGWVATPRDDC